MKVNIALLTVTDTRTFYSGDDIWQVPMEVYGTAEVPVEPYHITAQLGSKDKSEFLLLQPLSPLGRPNLSAWLAARNDGTKYGHFPKWFKKGWYLKQKIDHPREFQSPDCPICQTEKKKRETSRRIKSSLNKIKRNKDNNKLTK